MRTLVINELRMYAKKARSDGFEVRVIGRTTKTWQGWKWVAKAWNPDTKQFIYLLVKEVQG